MHRVRAAGDMAGAILAEIMVYVVVHHRFFGEVSCVTGLRRRRRQHWARYACQAEATEAGAQEGLRPDLG
jgi:hypothetical protein